MAQLTIGQKIEVAEALMREYSAIFKGIPITKQAFFNFLTAVDQELEQSEIDLFQSLPAGDAKTWLGNNQEVGRDIMVKIEEKRREVL